VDFIIDELNEKGLFAGKVAVVQPIAQGMADMINAQDGLYTVVLRGYENKREVIRKRVVSCIDTCINPYTDFDSYIEAAKNPDLRFVVSNTTKAGIAYKEGETADIRSVVRILPACLSARKSSGTRNRPLPVT